MEPRLVRSVLFPLSLSAALLALPGCDCDDCGDDDDGGGGIPTFLEQERNDDPLTANHFGTLFVGDQFFIDGNVRDDLADPFDGFAFTAGTPLHVDFELFIHNAAADLDVTLYDPQIDQTVASWVSEDNPEVGGVDVFAGGLDFHLVIESFVGDATYSLALTVLPLNQREALSGAGTVSLAAVGARGERMADADASYRKPASGPSVLLEQVFDVDLENGIVIERRRVLGL